MCPLKNECPKVKIQRWPSSSIKSHKKFGKDCPYAHHPLELQFPNTLKTRIMANSRKPKDNNNEFVHTGALKDCNGCSRCTMCKYKQQAQAVLEAKKPLIKKLNEKYDTQQIADLKAENDKNVDLFMKKFGILKKASVLLFYGRANDAFDEIAKAAQIIKNQREEERENELQV